MIESRIVECHACGEPVETPAEGGEAICEYCSLVQHVPARSAARPTPANPDVVQRDPYRAEKREAQRTRRNPYDLSVAPSGLERLDGASLRARWRDAVHALAAPHSRDDELRAAWLATTMAAAHQRRGDPRRARAVLETALDRLSEPAYRFVVLCRLARAATRAGQLELADAWLALCDEKTRLVELDSERVIAAALLALARGDHDGVLSAVDRSDEARSFASSCHPLADALRVHAYEASGHRARARELWRRAEARHGKRAMRAVASEHGLAEGTRRSALARALVVLVFAMVALFVAWKLLARA